MRLPSADPVFDTVVTFDPDRGGVAVDDMAACRGLLKNGSHSFYAASFLLSRETRDPSTALYAFCRIADDAVDNASGDADVIAQLTARVDGIYGTGPLAHPADRAFARVAKEYALPRSVVDALIEGFEWDTSGRRYETIEDVQAYAARVAGCVGIMMTTVMGKRGGDVLARAADLGVAMQLTNIARDVGEDARNGRLYLPTDWMEDAGIEPDQFLREPAFTPALGGVVKRLLNEAAVLYKRADAGIPLLPAGCRPGIRAARLIYAAIGDEVARNGYDSVTRRAVVPLSAKLPLLARSLVSRLDVHGLVSLPPLTATAFLVEAVVSTPVYPASAIVLAEAFNKPPAWWDIAGRFVTVLPIFERLERNQRAALAFGASKPRG
jgi:15-cis-phytoene synthase